MRRKAGRKFNVVPITRNVPLRLLLLLVGLDCVPTLVVAPGPAASVIVVLLLLVLAFGVDSGTDVFAAVVVVEFVGGSNFNDSY